MFMNNELDNIQDVNIIFNKLCRTPNIEQNIIKEYFEKYDIDIYTLDEYNKNSFQYICDNFENSSLKFIRSNIETMKHFIKYINKDDNDLLKDIINKLTEKFSNSKLIVTSLKTLYIQCNKVLYNNNINIKKVDILLKSIITENDHKKNKSNINRMLNYFEHNKNVNYNI